VASCTSVVGLVRSMGFEPLLGRGGLPLTAGKGFSSRVFMFSRADGLVAALKIRRAGAKRDSLALEGYILRAVAGLGVAPRVLSYGDDYILMEYISGVSMGDALELLGRGVVGVGYVREAVSSTIEALYKLDLAGVDHLEVGDPRRHVILQHGIPRSPRVIDFESATIKQNPTNVPRFVGGFILRRLRWILGDPVERVVEMMRTYKRTPAERGYIVERLLKSISRPS